MTAAEKARQSGNVRDKCFRNRSVSLTQIIHSCPFTGRRNGVETQNEMEKERNHFIRSRGRSHSSYGAISINSTGCSNWETLAKTTTTVRCPHLLRYPSCSILLRSNTEQVDEVFATLQFRFVFPLFITDHFPVVSPKLSLFPGRCLPPNPELLRIVSRRFGVEKSDGRTAQ